jgi:hypothetical protein
MKASKWIKPYQVKKGANGKLIRRTNLNIPYLGVSGAYGRPQEGRRCSREAKTRQKHGKNVYGARYQGGTMPKTQKQPY